jgi:hypothetical protein
MIIRFDIYRIGAGFGALASEILGQERPGRGMGGPP